MKLITLVTLGLRRVITKRIKPSLVMILVTLFASPVHSQSGAKPNPALQAVRPGANEPNMPNFWPGKDWPTATPESQGMSSARLDRIKERLAAKKTRAFLVVRNDRVVYEWYAPGVTPTTKQGRRPRRFGELPVEMDQRGRHDPASGVLRRRLLLGAPGDPRSRSEDFRAGSAPAGLEPLVCSSTIRS